jgi:hypothetical protein
MMFFSSAMKFTRPEGVPEHFAELGWSLPAITATGFLEVACTVVYLIPRAAVLGAILLTGYLGGGIAAHVRIGDYATVLFPFSLGILLWAGLYLRDPRLRVLVPLRT